MCRPHWKTETMRYRRKPVEIEAFRLFEEPWPAWFEAEVKRGRVIVNDGIEDGGEPFVHIYPAALTATALSVEGTLTAMRGEWIVQGREGALVSVPDHAFREMYEAVDDE